MACRLGVCEMNNNRPKPQKKTKKVAKKAVVDSSSDCESEGTCSGCSACCDSSSSCSCSECNLGTESSDSDCCGYACPPGRKPARSNKVLRCKDGVCEWVSKKKVKKPTTKRKSATKTKKPKKC